MLLPRKSAPPKDLSGSSWSLEMLFLMSAQMMGGKGSEDDIPGRMISKKPKPWDGDRGASRVGSSCKLLPHVGCIEMPAAPPSC